MGQSKSDYGQTRRVFFRTLGAGIGGTWLLPTVPGLAVEEGYPSLSELRAKHQKAGITLPDKTYRMMEWEFHTPPEGQFDIDVEAAMKAARDAGAESMLFYTQDHWGYAFYPTQVGVRHPHLKIDLFGTEVSLARRMDMSVVCYYSLQYNNQVVFTHPDWGWVNEKGEQQRRRARWFLPCLDTPYRQYVLGMMEEIFSWYEVDELFLDTFGIQFNQYNARGINPFCFCAHTEAAWNQEHPGDPYREGFKTREGWERRYQWHQKRTLVDMLDEIIAIARKHRPKVIIALNGGPESLPDAVMQRVSFIYSEPITTPTGISVGSILMRGWGRPDYQAGVFSEQGYLDTYPGSISRTLADGLIAQNARVFFVGNAPVISGIDGKGFSKRWFKVAKETWEDVRNVDGLLEGIQPVLSTAMLYSESTRGELAAQQRPVEFRQSTVGALETLTFSGRPVESVPEFRLTPNLLSQFETLVMPEVEVLSDEQAAMIRRWVEKGGTLVASHRCGLLDENHQPRSNFPLADVLGVDFVSEETNYAYDSQGKLKENFTAIYLESSGHSLAKLLAESTVGLPGSFLKLKRSGADEVMRYRLPFMVEDMTRNKWFNWGPPPPGGETAGTAVAYHRYGKGQAVYIGVPIFWAMHQRPFWIRRWVPDLMRRLVPNPIAELRPEPASEYVHGTFFWDKNKRFVLVQILNTVELSTDGEYRPIGKVQVLANPQKLRVTGARVVWPKMQDLAVETKEGKTHIVLGNPGRYAALYLKVA